MTYTTVNCHNETKHQINAITASFISSIYHSLSQSARPCRLVSRDINVTFINMVVAGKVRAIIA